MPLYIEDFEPLALPHAFMDALMKIAAAIGPEAVNPGTALKLLRSYVQPLVPEGHRGVFNLEGQATWERIRMLYPQLACAGEGKDKGLMAAAVIVDTLVRHTTRPARDVQFPRFVELSSFDRMCRLLHLPVAHPAVQLGLRDVHLFDFCKYCWLPVHSHGVCRYHTTTTRSSTAANGPSPVCAAAGLKAAHRLSATFGERLSALISAEERAFHDSGFETPVLIPPSGLRVWLEQRRPHLARAVSVARGSNESLTLTDMLAVLYGDVADPVAEAIGGAVYLLTPISTRAEAWLSAWDSRPRRGGARQRASKRQEAQLVPWSGPIRLVIVDWACRNDQDLPNESVDPVTSIAGTLARALGVHCEDLALGETLTLLEQQLEVMAEGLVGFEQVQLALSQARANAIENAAGLLNALPINVCIAAMASRVEVASRLDALGILHLFDGKLFCLEQPGQGISRAELLTSASNAMGVQPADCLVLTETPASVHAARSAGMRVLAVGSPSKHESLRQAGADIVWGG